MKHSISEKDRMPPGIETTFCAAIIDAFRANKRLADGAIAQVSDEQLRLSLGKDSNSIALIMKHVAGNLLSRWTNFLTTDGEKKDRNRDSEFADTFQNRQEVLDFWEQGWSRLFSGLSSLTSDDFQKTVLIRGEPHTVPMAMARSLGHTCYHIGQIVQLAQLHAGEKWTPLSIPRGCSEQFNQERWGVPGSSHS